MVRAGQSSQKAQLIFQHSTPEHPPRPPRYPDVQAACRSALSITRTYRRPTDVRSFTTNANRESLGGSLKKEPTRT
jgi:hypothetical protein